MEDQACTAHSLLIRSSMEMPERGRSSEEELLAPRVPELQVEGMRMGRVQQRRGARCCCRVSVAGCLPVVLLVLGLGIAATVQQQRREAELEPLLDAISSSAGCDAPTATCAVELSDTASSRFDLHPAENPLFGFLQLQVLEHDREKMKEVLCGAHLQIHDIDGSTYTFLTNLPGAWVRISSHDSDRAQYGIPEGRIVSSLLVGTLHNFTWLQLEAHPWDVWHDPVGSMGHALDYVKYRFTGMNVGPLGLSRFTDRHPLEVLHRRKGVAEACPQQCNKTLVGHLERWRS
eukprot:gnl/TRDRNA2_/TRDRNA2_56811_c0_seq1.p1 gnl/TRDRNA2_/TRDRNA2_56811_c0~~gnl/TRDRNA2_/TRDRNA2_56811_c0_seq1.p1  ORF type:complete len:297 (+),score=45.42 gnl/TRDRNA2_/TRDRNA2_56811_c0_seq1:26-892(+)